MGYHFKASSMEFSILILDTGTFRAMTNPFTLYRATINIIEGFYYINQNEVEQLYPHGYDRSRENTAYGNGCRPHNSKQQGDHTV